MTREVCNWRFVQTRTGIYVHCVGDVLGRLADIRQRWVDSFVLTSWSEQQTTVRCERKTPEEGCQCFVKVNRCVANTKSANAAHARRVWHDSR